MTHALRSLLAVALLAVLGPGCSNSGQNTQVMIVIDADPGVRHMTRNLVVSVYGGAHGTAQADLALVQEYPFAVSERAGWPKTIALAPLDRDATRIYRIEARAYDQADLTSDPPPIARIRAISGFAPNRTVVLQLLLQDSCLGVECTDVNTTCDLGRCVSAVHDVGTLPDWNPDASTPARDAGTSDAGMDAAMDASIDAARSDTGPVPDVGVDGGCTVAACSDGRTCTSDFCGLTGCEHLADDTACDDHNPCTDDRCDGPAGGDGCTHVANTVACDDGLFCNGLDHCAASSCSAHAGDPCGGLTCDEPTDHCLGCSASAPCPAAMYGAYSSCTYADACAETGTKMRTVRTFACVAGSCVASDGSDVTACTRTTTGNVCNMPSCDPAGSCSYGSTCALTGSAPETCHMFACALGACVDMPYASSVSCMRSTNGNSCDDGIACNSPDSCSAGVCLGAGSCDAGLMDAGSCDDGFACTVDTLSGGSCTFTPDDTRCDDGLACSTETCSPSGAGHDARGCVYDFAGCMPDTGPPGDAGITPCLSMPSLCNDGNPCTDDTCSPGAGGADANGCVHTPPGSCIMDSGATMGTRDGGP